MGSRVRNLRILESLATRFELRIVTLVHDPARLEDPGPVARLGEWVPVLAPHRRNLGAKFLWHLRARWEAWHHGLHRETFFQSFPALSQEAARQCASFQPEIVHVAYWYGLRHLRPFLRPPLWIVDTHDVQFERHERLWGRVSPRERAAEFQELARYDRILAITPHDRDVFVRELGSEPPCEVMPMGVDMAEWAPGVLGPAAAPAPRVVFYGNLANGSNESACRHLLADLVPAMKDRTPGLEVLVLGAGPSDDLRRLAASSPVPVTVTGFVEDVRPHLLSARVLALSLRSGSGQRGRVVEALALGVPVVGYAGGLEGLELADGEGIVIAADEAAFREAVARLLGDPVAAAELGMRGRRAVEQRYGTAATYARFPELYSRWLEAGTGGRTRGGAARKN